ncbi:Uncharacterised protein [Mycobacteroides abscessus subsp. abscessus]|nr:Uncharacterised protein [Mycobacteroides abscessus subsp. abscessus]
MRTAASSRVDTTYGIGSMAWASSASISSAMRMAPISAVIRHPAWAAKPTAAMRGRVR